jgi:hypothetical protein
VASSRSACRKHRLTYHSEELQRDVVVEIVSPDRIEPVTELRGVRPATGGYAYSYRLQNAVGPRTEQPLRRFGFPCPVSGEVEASGPAGWIVAIEEPHKLSDLRFRCTFLSNETEGIAPGGMVDFEIVTPWLPRIEPGRFWGLVPPVRFPSGEKQEHDQELHDLIQSVSGVTGGWVTSDMIAPVRDPAGLAPTQALRETMTTLDAACAAPRLISSEITCLRLKATLERAFLSLTAGACGTARGEIKSFLQQLSAERGKDVSENAYWLLWTNGDFLLSNIDSKVTEPPTEQTPK